MRPEVAEFSERLKASREKAGFSSPRDAARAFNWNENTYKSRENSMRGIPSFADVRIYARVFKVPFIWLLTGEPAIGGVALEPQNSDTEVPNSVTRSGEAYLLRGSIEKLHSNSILLSSDVLEKTILDACQTLRIGEKKGPVLARVLAAALLAASESRFQKALADESRSEAEPQETRSDNQGRK